MLRMQGKAMLTPNAIFFYVKFPSDASLSMRGEFAAPCLCRTCVHKIDGCRGVKKMDGWMEVQDENARRIVPPYWICTPPADWVTKHRLKNHEAQIILLPDCHAAPGAQLFAWISQVGLDFNLWISAIVPALLFGSVGLFWRVWLWSWPPKCNSELEYIVTLTVTQQSKLCCTCVLLPFTPQLKLSSPNTGHLITPHFSREVNWLEN